MRRRSTRTSVRPRRSPRTRTSPVDGCSYIAAIRSSVVLPDPLAPRITHRCVAVTFHVNGDRIIRSSRTKLTLSSRKTAVPMSSGWLSDDMETRRYPRAYGEAPLASVGALVPSHGDASNSGDLGGGLFFRAAVDDDSWPRRRHRRREGRQGDC